MFRFKGTIIRPNMKTQYWYIVCFHIWPGDGSFETKHVTEFLILFTIYIVVLLTGISYYKNCHTYSLQMNYDEQEQYA